MSNAKHRAPARTRTPGRLARSCRASRRRHPRRGPRRAGVRRPAPGPGTGPGFPFPDQGGPVGSGRMTWRGTVDDDVRIVIRGGTADVETIGGSPYYDAVTNFTAALPLRRTNVTLTKRRGRGEMFIEQQPSRQNNFAAVIRIRDSRGGAAEYEFDLAW